MKTIEELKPISVALLYQRHEPDGCGVKVTSSLRLWTGYARSEAEALGMAVSQAHESTKGMALDAHLVAELKRADIATKQAGKEGV